MLLSILTDKNMACLKLNFASRLKRDDVFWGCSPDRMFRRFISDNNDGGPAPHVRHGGCRSYAVDAKRGATQVSAVKRSTVVPRRQCHIGSAHRAVSSAPTPGALGVVRYKLASRVNGVTEECPHAADQLRLPVRREPVAPKQV